MARDASGASDQEFSNLIHAAISRKPERHELEPPAAQMHQPPHGEDRGDEQSPLDQRSLSSVR